MVDVNLITQFVECAVGGDRSQLRRTGSAIAKSLENSNEKELARRVRKALRQHTSTVAASEAPIWTPRDDASRLPLVEEMAWPSRPSLIDVKAGRAITRFLEDIQHVDMLREAGIAVRLGLLMHGAPGTGKTHLAGHIAQQLNVPIFTARLDALISSRLGETSKNIRGVFDFIGAKQGILFLDEMDAIAKLRDDKQELGELKRVVNTVLQAMDSLPDHVVVIGATNHPHLLDSAIWRRFPYKIELLSPDTAVREQLWAEFLGRDAPSPPLGLDWLADISQGLTGAEIEQIALAARRSAIVGECTIKPWEFVRAVEAVRIGDGIIIDGADPSTEEKREVAAILQNAGRSAAEAGRILGITRQMAHRYMKEAAHG